MALQLGIYVGQIISIDVFRQSLDGQIVPSIKVKSYLDGSTIDIPWIPIGANQAMPMGGQDCVYITTQGRDPRMIQYWGKNSPNIRKGAYGLNEGEVVVQSDSGLGYLKIADDGSTELTTGDAICDLLQNSDGATWTLPALVITTPSGAEISIDEDSTISLSRTASDGTIQAELTLDAKNNATLQVKGDVTIKGNNIYLDGKVSLGPGASDPTQAAAFGLAVSSGLGGTYPFDEISGEPIPGSTSVRVAS